jgi:hypothetical protein
MRDQIIPGLPAIESPKVRKVKLTVYSVLRLTNLAADGFPIPFAVGGHAFLSAQTLAHTQSQWRWRVEV